jgi:hypothetical protein
MRTVHGKWLVARRDALIDQAVALAIPPVALLALLWVTALPPVVLSSLGGFAVGALLGGYKKNVNW